jgi:hypothetical protein
MRHRNRIALVVRPDFFRRVEILPDQDQHIFGLDPSTALGERFDGVLEPFDDRLARVVAALIPFGPRSAEKGVRPNPFYKQKMFPLSKLYEVSVSIVG